METSISSAVEKIKDFVDGVLRRCHAANRRNPIEILKRLQRETFSDLMKIRDRQAKVEQLLLFNKTSNVSPFQEVSTRVRGLIDVSGVLLMLDHIDQQHEDAVQRAGIKTGVSSKFTFQTSIREKDTLTAEFATRGEAQGDVIGSPLSLAKVHYHANISDWFSIVSTPVGAQCRDVAIKKNYCQILFEGLEEDIAHGVPLLLKGGETEAIQRLNKLTAKCQRQPLIGSQMVPWVLNGCVSPRYMFHEIEKSARLISDADTALSNSIKDLIDGMKMNEYFGFCSKQYHCAKEWEAVKQMEHLALSGSDRQTESCAITPEKLLCATDLQFEPKEEDLEFMQRLDRLVKASRRVSEMIAAQEQRKQWKADKVQRRKLIMDKSSYSSASSSTTGKPLSPPTPSPPYVSDQYRSYSFIRLLPRWSHDANWKSASSLRSEIRTSSPLPERLQRNFATMGKWAN